MKYRIRLLLLIIILSLLTVNTSCIYNKHADISSVLSDEAGNTYTAWRMVRSVGDHDVHLRKISSGGNVLWDKTLFTGDNRRVNISGLVSDGNGGVYVGWEVLTPKNGKEGRHYFDRDTLVNVNGQGDITINRDFFIQAMQMISDGQGGVLLGWSTRENTRVEKVDNRGTTIWEYQFNIGKTNLQFTAGTDGESFILWKSTDNPYSIVQKLNPEGRSLWGDSDIPEGVQINAKDTKNPRIVSDGMGGVFVSWAIPTAGGMIGNTGGYHISAEGDTVYDESRCDLVSPTNNQARAISDSSGGIIIVWEDHRSSMALYAQKLNDECQSIWQENGAAVCVNLPRISPRFEAISNGEGGIIVFWIDGDRRLSAQMLDSSGQKQWADKGIQIAKNVSNLPILVSGDKQNGFTVGWSTVRNIFSPGKSYIQKISAEGNMLWGDRGIELTGKIN